MDPHSFSLLDPDPGGKLKGKTQKNGRNFEVNLDQLHGFSLFSNIFLLFYPQKTLFKVIIKMLQLDPDPY